MKLVGAGGEVFRGGGRPGEDSSSGSEGEAGGGVSSHSTCSLTNQVHRSDVQSLENLQPVRLRLVQTASSKEEKPGSANQWRWGRAAARS